MVHVHPHRVNPTLVAPVLLDRLPEGTDFERLHDAYFRACHGEGIHLLEILELFATYDRLPVRGKLGVDLAVDAVSS